MIEAVKKLLADQKRLTAAEILTRIMRHIEDKMHESQTLNREPHSTGRGYELAGRAAAYADILTEIRRIWVQQ